jgi:hypothetical protein
LYGVLIVLLLLSSVASVGAPRALGSTVCKARVALVQPTFTVTPYSLYDFGSFYHFYHTHRGQQVVTTGLSDLQTPVSDGANWNDGWGQDYTLFSVFTAFLQANSDYCSTILNDIGVHGGALFNGSARNFDVVVIGHEEYLTRQEYNQFQQFVAEGGRLIGMSGNLFYAQVSYANGTETLVSGHGWVFNGTVALANKIQPFAATNYAFVGGNYIAKMWVSNPTLALSSTTAVGSSLIASLGHAFVQLDVGGGLESDSMDNQQDTWVIGNWSMPNVFSYIHRFGSGYVVCLCVYSEDTFSPYFTQAFLTSSIVRPIPGILRFDECETVSRTSCVN